MNKKLTEEQYAAVLSALDEALSQGDWASSSFLTQIGLKLQKIRDDFAQSQVEEGFSRQEISIESLKQQADTRSQMMKVFIALYAYDGGELPSWERVIANLPTQMVSRPVYANEEDLLAILRTKAKSVNDAYVSVYIEPSDIIERQSEKGVFDKLGVPLLSIKNNAVKLGNLDLFVHQTGNYYYLKGHLVRK